MSIMEIKQVGYSYDNKKKVLKGVNAEMEQGKLYAILGPSGCGKTTLLSLIGGLDSPGSGQIYFDGQDIAKTGLSDHRKNHVAFIFQAYNLIDYLTPAENVSLTSKLPPLPILERLGLTKEEAKRNVLKLSGGQQQRVAIARALVKMPRILLLDEPLSNLDARLRLQTREEIRRIQRSTGITTVFVTHDQEEAMSISDQIVVMKDGVIQQAGAPQEVYDSPANLFVAKFLGNPPINVFDAQVKNQTLYIGEEGVLPVPSVEDQSVTAAIRPEGFLPKADGALTCNFSSVEIMGRDISVVSTHPCSQNATIRAIISGETPVTTGKTVRFDLKKNKVFLFSKEDGARIFF